RHVGAKLLEVHVAGDEVGLAVHLEQHADAVVRVDVAEHGTFGGDATGLLGRLREPLFAEVLDGLVEVAIDLDQGLFGVERARLRTLAERLDQRSGDRHRKCVLATWSRGRGWGKRSSETRATGGLSGGASLELTSVRGPSGPQLPAPPSGAAAAAGAAFSSSGLAVASAVGRVPRRVTSSTFGPSPPVVTRMGSGLESPMWTSD